MKLFKITLIFAGLIAFSTVANATPVAQTAGKTSSVVVSEPVRQLCGLLDELSVNLAAGKITAIDDMTSSFERLGPDVENIPLSVADKDALKKSLGSLMNVMVKASVKSQGLNYDSLDAGTKAQLDSMIKTAIQVANESIDKSNTLKEAGELLKSF